VTLDRLAVVWPGDDMGFRTGTLIRPEQLRTYVLPWHKRFAAIAYEAGRPYFLHSCGNIVSIMDDLIDDVKIDAKHSFEDAILPVAEFQARYGRRIGVLGQAAGVRPPACAEDHRRVRSPRPVCPGFGQFHSRVRAVREFPDHAG
jgi:hypothetical protein